jgi:nitronate monooxygenase
MEIETPLTKLLGIRTPLICGAMYPCSNPELVAAVSEAGGLGVVQPISMMYVFGHDLKAGLQLINAKTQKPWGFNAIIQKMVKAYEDRMRRWIDIALECGVKLIITALGSPGWVVERARPHGVPVFHDVINREHALKARDQGVSGLICVNSRAGGHLGPTDPRALHDQLADLGLPLVCAGGIGTPQDFAAALAMGYAGVQMGTRFIATTECQVHDDYKQAIVRAQESDIVVTDKLDGVDCAVIKTPYFEKNGTKSGPLARWLLSGRFSKRLIRLFYAGRGLMTLKGAARGGLSYRDVFQAGKSVAGIDRIEPAGDIVRRFHEHAVRST